MIPGHTSIVTYEPAGVEDPPVGSWLTTEYGEQLLPPKVTLVASPLELRVDSAEPLYIPITFGTVILLGPCTWCTGVSVGKIGIGVLVGKIGAAVLVTICITRGFAVGVQGTSDGVAERTWGVAVGGEGSSAGIAESTVPVPEGVAVGKISSPSVGAGSVSFPRNGGIGSSVWFVSEVRIQAPASATRSHTSTNTAILLRGRFDKSASPV